MKFFEPTTIVGAHAVIDASAAIAPPAARIRRRWSAREADAAQAPLTDGSLDERQRAVCRERQSRRREGAGEDTVGSTIDKPRKMYSPRPPAPIAAAIVAVPTPITVDTRRPLTIEGSASGSSTSRSRCAR